VGIVTRAKDFSSLKHLLCLSLCLLIVGIAGFLIWSKTNLAQKFLAPDWIQTKHYAGWMLQNYWGDMQCNPTDISGTNGQWGVAPDGIAGWPTGLTHQDYKIEITYHGNPNCCGDQSADNNIWIGGNGAEESGVNFVGPAAPSIGYSRLMWKGVEIARTPKIKRQWHTYTIIKVGNAATLQLDGTTIVTDTASLFPTQLILGGQCWTGCQSPNMISACLFGDWNNFGYNITFYSAATNPILTSAVPQ